MQAIAIQAAAQVICGCHKQLPQHFRFPRRKRFRVHGVDVRVGKQAQALQPFERSYRSCECRNGRRIENIPPLHSSGHVQVMLDQKSHFGFFFWQQFQTRRSARQRGHAAVHMVLDRHAFAGVMQQQCKNQQVTAFLHFPDGSKLCSARIGRFSERLQMFDSA